MSHFKDPNTFLFSAKSNYASFLLLSSRWQICRTDKSSDFQAKYPLYKQKAQNAIRHGKVVHLKSSDYSGNTGTFLSVSSKNCDVTILITSIQALPLHLVNSQWRGKYSQYCLKWGGEEGATRCMWLAQNCRSKTWLLGESSTTWNGLLWKWCQICWFIFSAALFFNPFSRPSRQSTALFSQNTSVRVLLTNLTGWLYTSTPKSVVGC